MALKPRTRSLPTWLPAAALVVIIGAIVLITFAVQGSWWAEESPDASADQKASDGSSMLTDAGFDYVNVEGTARVRIGEGSLPAEELGLAADAEKTAEFRRPVRVIVAEGDEVYVVEDVGGLTAVSRAGELASVTVAFDSPGTWTDEVDHLRGLGSTYEWDAASIDALDEQIVEVNRSGSDEPFTATIGPSDGDAAVTANLTFDPGSGATALTLTFERGA